MPEFKNSSPSQRHEENLSGDEFSSPNNPLRMESKRSHTIKNHLDHYDDHDYDNLEDWIKRKNDFFLPMKKKYGSIEDLDPK